MTLDLEAVARALFAAENDPILWCDHPPEVRRYYRDSARIAADMIRAQVLEEAAQVAEDYRAWASESWVAGAHIAASIRAMKEQP